MVTVITQHKRTFALILLCVIAVGMLLIIPDSAYAARGNLDVSADRGGAKLKAQTEKIANNIASFIWGILGVVAAIFFIWAFVLFMGGSNDPQKIAIAKRRLAFGIVALVGAFMADKIVGLILGLFDLT